MVYSVFNYIPSPYIWDAQYAMVVASDATLGVASIHELHWSMLEQVTRLRVLMLRSVLEQLINRNAIYVTEGFRNLAENTLPLCSQIIASMDIYLSARGVNVAKYVLDVYDLGEGEYSELRPFIEVYVRVEDVNEMLKIWEDTINFLKATLGNGVLEYIDIFFTRA